VSVFWPLVVKGSIEEVQFAAAWAEERRIGISATASRGASNRWARFPTLVRPIPYRTTDAGQSSCVDHRAMSTFALIHGAHHGGWCWEPLLGELERRGHRGVAPDLPVEKPYAGALAYAYTVAEALDGADDDVVVVGHALGGLAAPIVATLRPVRHMVFVAGLVPRPGRSFMDELTEHPTALLGCGVDGAAPDGVCEPQTFARAFETSYNDLSLDVAYRAWVRLRMQALRPLQEITPLERWPAVGASSIVMAEDRAVSPVYLQAVAEAVLGTVPVALPGGHSPFLSRPAELADVLVASAVGVAA
jgi:pimeloyl-ACP methyl ester carboxylesterase